MGILLNLFTCFKTAGSLTRNWQYYSYINKLGDPNEVYAVVTNCNTKAAVLLETLIVTIIYQAMNGVDNTIVHTLQDYTFCMNRMSDGFAKAAANIYLTK